MQASPSPKYCPACRDLPQQVSSGPKPPGWLLMLSGSGIVALAALSILAITSLVSPAQADTGPGQAQSPVQIQALPTPMRQKELIHMVRQECGFCHGLRLTGGLGSPLTAQAMQDKPMESLEAAIRYGIPGTAMPGWEPFLSESETRWIVQNLQQGFPNDN